MKTNTLTAKNLKPGMEIQSSSGKWLKVTSVKHLNNKVVVLFDGDMEVDFAPYFAITTVR